jgi:hypothetical protein
MLSPIAFRSSSLKPLSRTFPQIPPALPPTTADAMMLGEDQADEAAGDRSPFRPPLTARVGRLLERHLSLGLVNDHGRVDEIDGSLAVHRLKVLKRLLGLELAVVDRDEQLNRVFGHVRSFRVLCRVRFRFRGAASSWRW